MPSRNALPLPAALVALALAALPAAAQLPSNKLLVVDVDAAGVSATSAGALLNVDTTLAADVPPVVEAAADAGAPFQFLAGAAISPIDGRTYIADWGAGGSPVPRILAVASDGTTQVIAQGDPLVQPYGLAFDSAGRLFVADWEADPGNFGGDTHGGLGHGAIFVIDVPACTPPCTPAALATGRNHAFGGLVLDAFEDPVDVEWDPVTRRLYVVDLTSSVTPFEHLTAIYRVNPTTGRVEAVVATRDDWNGLISLAVRPDGDLVVVDTGLGVGDSSVWEIDVQNTDPEGNAVEISSGAQYAVLESVTVDAADRVFVLDSGEWDDVLMDHVQDPAVYRIDEGQPVTTNAILESREETYLLPIWVGAVPEPDVDAITPSVLTGPTSVTITGTSLSPGMRLDFGPGFAVGTVDWDPVAPLGTALQVLVSPVTGGGGCSGDLTYGHAFGTSKLLPDAISFGSPTGPPRSSQGDANGDGIVDGLDLAILGRSFGLSWCMSTAFANDADFNDDDVVDGQDLAILAAFFGLRL